MKFNRFNSMLMALCLFFAAQQMNAQCNITLSANVTDVLCFGGSNGAIDLTVNGGTPPYFAAWSNGLMDIEDIADLAAGTYTVTVTDDLGCTASLSKTINQPASLTASISGRNLDCYYTQFTGNPYYSTDLSAGTQGGTPPYFFVWSNSAVGSVLPVTEPGTYTVTVSDGQSCWATAERVVVYDTISPIADAGLDVNFDCQTTELTLGGNGSSSGANIEYAWSGPGGNFQSQFPTVSATGIYTLFVSNTTNLCWSSNSVAVGGIVTKAGPDMGIPCGGGQVTLDGGASSSGVNYTHNWFTGDGNIVSGSNTLNPTVDEAGTYILNVFDIINVCSKSDTVRVFPGPAIPLSDLSVTKVSCFGQLGRVILTMNQGTAPYSYLWSNGAITKNLLNVPAATYSVTVTDATGCNFYAEVVVGEETSMLVLNAQATNPDCSAGSNGAIDLTVTGNIGGIDYAWSTGETTQDIVNLGAGVYTVTVSDLSTCPKTLSVTLTDAFAINLSAVVIPATNCINGNGAINLTVTPAGSYTYSWSNGGASEDLANLVHGNYTVTVSAGGSCTATATYNVPDNPNLPNPSALLTQSTCDLPNGSINASVTGGIAPYTYLWSNGATTQDLSFIVEGQYVLTVTGANGCTNILSVVVGNNNPSFTLTETIAPNTVCNGNPNGSIDLDIAPAGPYTYIWSDSRTTQDINGLAPGNYTVTVSAGGTCTQAATYNVPDNANSPNLATNITNASCNGNDGGIDLTVTGGTPAYTYIWSNGHVVQDCFGLVAGTYTVTVTDAAGCTQTASATVGQNSDVALSTTATNAPCSGGCDGSIDLTVTGGMPPYNYFWGNGSTNQDLNNLCAGTYTVTVLDASGCTKTASASIGQASVLSITETHVNVLCFGSASGSIDLTVSGGTSPYTFSWSNLAITQDLTASSAGTYTVTVTDNNGCTKTLSATITQPTSLNTSATINTVSCFGGNNGAINLTVTGGVAPYTYIWNNGTTTQDLPNLPAGAWTVTVTDANGCTATNAFLVTEPTQITFDILSLSNNCSFETITGPNLPGFTYQWSGPNNFTATTPAITANFSGLYNLTITNTNGCTATNNYSVNLLGTGACGAIKGHVIRDEDENCLVDIGEPGLTGWIVRAEGANDTLYGVTNVQGRYVVGVPVGTYAMKVLSPNGLWSVCPGGSAVSVGMAGDTVQGGDFPVQAAFICPALTVSIGTNQLRRCFSGNYYHVEYCNTGTETAQDAYITVVLDQFLTVISASAPYTDLGSNALHFELGDLTVGECGTFNIQVKVNCNAQLGQTHCTQVSIYPDTLCAPQNANWSGASLQVSSLCNADSLQFKIQNVGTGSMNGSSGYIVVEDGVMFRTGIVSPLSESAEMIVSVPANGSTWRLEVGQELFHPYPSPVGLSVEGCATSGSISTGFVNQFSAPDEPPSIDFDCTTNIGSFDPNDKYGYPVGYGADHYVRPGTDIEYLIRFQNTGTDTAFTVQIIDTLSSWLDPATIRFGASSHPYRYDLDGEGIVHFIFENILLPDSNNNAIGSNGFAKFIIKPRSDAPLETLIENTAAIYFDFNDPVFTNTSFHRLGENFVTVGLWQPWQPDAQVSVVPNPFSDHAVLEVTGLARYGGLRLQVFDLRGNIVREMESENEFFQLKTSDWPSGLYLFKISQNGRLVGNGKLAAE